MRWIVRFLISILLLVAGTNILPTAKASSVVSSPNKRFHQIQIASKAIDTVPNCSVFRTKPALTDTNKDKGENINEDDESEDDDKDEHDEKSLLNTLLYYSNNKYHPNLNKSSFLTAIITNVAATSGSCPRYIKYRVFRI